MPLPDQMIKPDNIIESQPTHSPISPSQDVSPAQSNGAKNIQQIHPLTPQNESPIEVSKEVSGNIENSLQPQEVDGGSPSLQPTAKNSEYAQPLVQIEEEEEDENMHLPTNPPYSNHSSFPQYTTTSSNYIEPLVLKENASSYRVSNTPDDKKQFVFGSFPQSNFSFQSPYGPPSTTPGTENGAPLPANLFRTPLDPNEDVLLKQSQERDDDGNLSMVSSNFDEKGDDEQSEASYISEGEEQPELPAIENMTPQQLQDELSQAREHIQQLEQGNQGLIEEQNKLWEEKEKIKNNFITEQQSGVELSVKLRSTYEQIEELNTQIENLNKQLEAKDQGIEKLQQQPLNAKVEKLNKDLEAKNTEVQQLQKKNKELEAKKQPTEQSKAPTYTAAVGMGLAAGLVAFIALERTVRLDIWVTVGIALASALAASGATYLALKPSTQVNKVETQEVNNNALEKQPA